MASIQTIIWVPGAEHATWFSDANITESEWEQFMNARYAFFGTGYSWVAERFTYNNKPYLKLKSHNPTADEIEAEILVPYGQGFSIQYGANGRLIKASVLCGEYSGGNGMHSAETQTYNT